MYITISSSLSLSLSLSLCLCVCFVLSPHPPHHRWVYVFSNHIYWAYWDAFEIFRYNFEEVLINSCHNLYGHSICCDVWSYFDCKLFVRNFYCIYLNAPGNLRQTFLMDEERKERSVLLLISLFDLLLLFSL